MRPNGEPKRRKSTATRASSPSPSRRRGETTVRSATLLDNELATEEEISTLFTDLRISSADSTANPRGFPYSVKQQCWEKAEKVRGRDPDRWRKDALGNVVFRKLVGCPGCLCHDYDHILPYSKVTSSFSFFSFFSFYDVGVVIFGDELGLVLFCLLCKILINLLVLSASILQIKVRLLVNFFFFFRRYMVVNAFMLVPSDRFKFT